MRHTFNQVKMETFRPRIGNNGDKGGLMPSSSEVNFVRQQGFRDAGTDA
jgi:hypothetical protein